MPDSDQFLADIEAVQDELTAAINETPTGRMRVVLTNANIIIGAMKNSLFDPVVPET